jgi:periplasmic divalent cation tolerance protein
MNKILLTITTMPNNESAKKLALLLLNSKYCACINIIPNVTSIYSWENKIEETEECLLKIKSKITDKNYLLKQIQKNHPYDIPQILQLEIETNQKYYDWIYTV